MEKNQCDGIFFEEISFYEKKYVDFETFQEVLKEKNKKSKALDDVCRHLISEREMTERLKLKLSDYEKRLKEEMQKNFELQEKLNRMEKQGESNCNECNHDDIEAVIESVIYKQQCEIEVLNSTIEVLVKKLAVNNEKNKKK